MATQTKVIGPISAYAIAVQEGYTGSKSEWAAEIGNAQENAQIAQAAADRAQSLTESLPADFDDIVGNFAKFYSELTFPVQAGTYCIHEGVMYKANTLIESSETWTSSHWTQVNTGEEMVTLKNDVGATIVTSLADTVKYIYQNKSDEAKTQARTNIGAASATDVDDLKSAFNQITDETIVYSDNLLPPVSEVGYWDVTTGEAVTNGSFTRSKNAIPCKNSGTFYFALKSGATNVTCTLLQIDENGDVLTYKQLGTNVPSVAINSNAVAFKVYVAASNYNLADVCIQYGSATYVPYTETAKYIVDPEALPETYQEAVEITSEFSRDEAMFEPVVLVTKATAEYTEGMWTTSGAIATTTAALNYYSINLIDVEPGMQIRMNYFTGLYQLYNQNGNDGTQSDVYTVATQVNFTVPQGKYKLGIAVMKSKFYDGFVVTQLTPNSEEKMLLPYAIDNFSLKVGNVQNVDAIQMLSHLKGQKIVNFGDSIFGNFRDDSGEGMSISAMLAKRTGATCLNAGFGGCRMAAHSEAIWDAFSMYRLADSIYTESWTLQETALTNGAGTLPTYFSDTLQMLEGIDWTTVDIITIGYGTNDFASGVSETDFKAALQTSIQKIQTKYHHIKVMVISPMWRWFIVDGNYDHNSDTTSLPSYCDWCKEIAEINHVVYCDTYKTLGINQYNYLQYFNSNDGTHPKYEGRLLRANKIAGELLLNY